MNWIRSNQIELLAGLLCFSIFIVFEVYQQLYYTRNYTESGGEGITFFTVLNAHLLRWSIWVLLSLILVFYVTKNPLKRGEMSSIQLLKYLVVIIGVLFLNLMAITGISLTSGEMAAGWPAFQELFIYFFFHKIPLYFIMLAALTVVIHYFQNRDELELVIGEVGELRRSNAQLNEELRNSAVRDESFVLQVKTGTRTKLVPVEEIIWIEADDYCVRIHDKNNQTHTLRSSMKALDEKLEFYGFLRVHRKAIVNMNFVTEFVQNGRTELILRNGSVVPVAQSRLSSLKSALQTI